MTDKIEIKDMVFTNEPCTCIKGTEMDFFVTDETGTHCVHCGGVWEDETELEKEQDD